MKVMNLVQDMKSISLVASAKAKFLNMLRLHVQGSGDACEIEI